MGINERLNLIHSLFAFFSFFRPIVQIKRYEKLETVEERRKLAREIYDNFIMKELLSHTHVMPRVFIMRFFFSLVAISPRLFFSSFLSVPVSFAKLFPPREANRCISVLRSRT